MPRMRVTYTFTKEVDLPKDMDINNASEADFVAHAPTVAQDVMDTPEISYINVVDDNDETILEFVF